MCLPLVVVTLSDDFKVVTPFLRVSATTRSNRRFAFNPPDCGDSIHPQHLHAHRPICRF